ncbi:acetyl-CoA carboxylase, carboxyltransferase subunit beta [Fodinicurvata sp. EGI_FJ10296]|uniref:acetyl-CoA carboxylase, carboxyltransferase subunit beta n=1 Tax=Fodinicurvata sp. EGI_FJ10296 TaxID=3231908 RepID=UPI0034549032
MNWLTNFVRPRFRALVAKQDVPDSLWDKCPNCEAMIFHRDLEEAHYVCQHCGHHMRLPPKKRFEHLFDDGLYETIELPKAVVDPLKFRDSKRYTDRLKEAQTKTGRSDAIIVAHGKVKGNKTVIAAFDFSFMGGSMGVAVGEGLVSAARLAVSQRAALVAIPASGGARMQEGMLSLMQMPRTTIAVQQVKEAGLPYIVVLTDPTTGGVTASFAMLGDVHIAERGAQIGFAGARVIEETIRETLPEGFQRAEYLLEHGMVDIVCHRQDLPGTLGRIIDLLLNAQAPKPATAAKTASNAAQKDSKSATLEKSGAGAPPGPAATSKAASKADKSGSDTATKSNGAGAKAVSHATDGTDSGGGHTAGEKSSRNAKANGKAGGDERSKS